MARAKAFTEDRFEVAMIASSYVIRQLFVWLYSAMIKEGMMPDIKELPRAEMDEYLKDADRIAAALDEKGRRDFLKGYYAFGQMLGYVENN